jgi:hypothetical protein
MKKAHHTRDEALMLDNSDGRFDDPEDSDEDEGPLLPYAPGVDPDGDLPDVPLPPAESSASSANNPFAELFADDDREEEEEEDGAEEAACSSQSAASDMGAGKSKRSKKKGAGKSKKGKSKDDPGVVPPTSSTATSINFEALVELDEDEGPLEEYRPGADPDGDLPELSQDDLLALGGSSKHGASVDEEGKRSVGPGEGEALQSTAAWIESHRTQHSPSRQYTKVGGSNAKVRNDPSSGAGAIGEVRRNPFAELFGDNDTDDNEDEEDEEGDAGVDASGRATSAAATSAAVSTASVPPSPAALAVAATRENASAADVSAAVLAAFGPARVAAARAAGLLSTLTIDGDDGGGEAGASEIGGGGGTQQSATLGTSRSGGKAGKGKNKGKGGKGNQKGGSTAGGPSTDPSANAQKAQEAQAARPSIYAYTRTQPAPTPAASVPPMPSSPPAPPAPPSNDAAGADIVEQLQLLPFLLKRGKREAPDVFEHPMPRSGGPPQDATAASAPSNSVGGQAAQPAAEDPEDPDPPPPLRVLQLPEGVGGMLGYASEDGRPAWQWRVWGGPRALVMALQQLQSAVAGAVVLDLASGAGLAVLAAARLDAALVVATDLPHALPLLQRNLAANGAIETSTPPGAPGDDGATPGGRARCPGGHALKRSVAKCEDHVCNVCGLEDALGSGIALGQKVHSCRRCDFDVCGACVSLAQEGRWEQLPLWFELQCAPPVGATREWRLGQSAVLVAPSAATPPSTAVGAADASAGDAHSADPKRRAHELVELCTQHGGGAVPSIVLASVCSHAHAQPMVDAVVAVLSLLPATAFALVAHEKLEGRRKVGGSKSKKEPDLRKQFAATMTQAGLAYDVEEATATLPERQRAAFANVRLWRVRLASRSRG